MKTMAAVAAVMVVMVVEGERAARLGDARSAKSCAGDREPS